MLRSLLARLLAQAEGPDAIDLGEPSVVHVASSGTSADLAFVGSSPWGRADTASTFLEVPESPLDGDRFLFRVAGWTIPAGKAARLLGFGLCTEIGVRLANSDGSIYPLRFPISTPGWSFTDGNVTWAITRRRSIADRTPTLDPFEPPGWSCNVDDLRSALVYVAQVDRGAPTLPTTYQAPPGFPGSPVEGLSMRDQRNGWHDVTATGIDVAIEGGQDVVLWASVRQSNPDDRPAFPTLADGYDLGALGPEDRFLRANPRAVIARLAGYLALEIGPSNRNANHLINAPGRRC